MQHIRKKSFPSHKAHRAALNFVSSALRQAPIYTARLHRAVCLFIPQLLF